MSYAIFLAKNLHLSIGEEFCTFPCQKFAPLSQTPLLNGAEFTLSVAKYVALETVRIVRRFDLSNCDRGSKYRNKRSNFRLNRPSSHRKK